MCSKICAAREQLVEQDDGKKNEELESSRLEREKKFAKPCSFLLVSFHRRQNTPLSPTSAT